MEWVVQCLDDVDDLVAAVRLLGERIRHGVIVFLLASLFIAAQAGAVVLALQQPPLALATALLLFVTLLYRSVTSRRGALEIA
jgi:hypothetical protein